MAVVIVGVVLLVAAAIGFYFMRRARDELHAMIGAETLPVNELELLRKASDEVGARGGFRKECEVVGAAHPRPEGMLISELSKRMRLVPLCRQASLRAGALPGWSSASRPGQRNRRRAHVVGGLHAAR
ncbi:hypothetical protein [Saccharopolyspora hattusasensis]|uniref:hypothetical protein n=1 Tax=Saccharopolyspora hattusasensis TaxID=1128679 RepID=UPI003D985531